MYGARGYGSAPDMTLIDKLISDTNRAVKSVGSFFAALFFNGFFICDFEVNAGRLIRNRNGRKL